MMESAWDKQLWQHKMQQLPLEGDENAMWQNMQSLLDGNMPDGPSGSGPVTPKNLPGTATIISAIIVVLAVAGLLWYLLHHPKTNNQQKTENKVTKIQNDSLAGSANNPHNATDAADKKPAATHASETDADKRVKKNAATIKSTATNTSAAAGKSAGNSGDNHMPNGHHSSHGQQFSRGQNSLNTGLKGTESKTGGARYPSRQNLVKNHNTAAVNHPGTNSQYQSVNINTDNAPGRQQSTKDTISSLLKASHQVAQNGILRSAKTDSSTIKNAGNNSGNKPSAQNNTSAKNQTNKNAKPQTKSAKKQRGNSKFEFDLRYGLNTGSGSSSFPGITAGYSITPKVGIMVGADVMASRTLSGSYVSSSPYTYRVDTGKAGLRSSGTIAISGSRKLYTIDVPINVNYHINKYVSVYGGPVISIPVKANATKSKLSLLENSNDTTRAYVAPYVSSTSINNKLNYGFSGGIRLNYNRVFISGGYMQDFQGYTIGSGLGSSKINPYRTVQFGIGYQLFKPKK